MTTKSSAKPRRHASSVAKKLGRAHMRIDARAASGSAKTLKSLSPDQSGIESHAIYVRGNSLAADLGSRESQKRSVGGNHPSGDHVVVGAQTSTVAGNPIRQAKQLASSKGISSAEPPYESCVSPRLGLAAETLDDIERPRIAVENRLRSICRRELEGEGRDPNEIKGYSGQKLVDWLRANYTDPDLHLYGAQLLRLVEQENELVKNLERIMRHEPLAPIVKSLKGVGAKQCARLLAAIGDPYIREAQVDRDTGEIEESERPRRGPAELWAYCGLAPDQKKKKETRCAWNHTAKMRAVLVAKSAQKAGVRELDSCDHSGDYDVEGREAITPLGETYLLERARWASRETSELHRHNHAIRVVAKEILKDLFLAAKEIHA